MRLTPRSAGAATVVVGAVVVAVVAATGGNDPAGTAACRPQVHYGTIPAWARGGFSGDTRMHYVVGQAGRIAGLVFGYPLHSPAVPGRQNKILWVAKVAPGGGSDLRISAQRLAATAPRGAVVRWVVSGGPGPSLDDLPAPGCWRLTLRWAGTSDAVDLDYAAARAG
ncbi:MAG: hypothetical protein QOG68_626 [Solirubrobacteraceae bacterium]|nr:hypothetical protein [Solirubrobacteraceae bacterium]